MEGKHCFCGWSESQTQFRKESTGNRTACQSQHMATETHGGKAAMSAFLERSPRGSSGPPDSRQQRALLVSRATSPLPPCTPANRRLHPMKIPVSKTQQTAKYNLLRVKIIQSEFVRPYFSRVDLINNSFLFLKTEWGSS